MKHYEKEAKQLLRMLGMNGSYIGFHQLAYGIARTIEDESLLTYICKGLYIEIAIYFHTDVRCVERNIRTVKEKIWKQGNKHTLGDIFGVNLQTILKNAEFIDQLAQYLMNTCTELELIK